MLILCYHKIDCVQQDWTGIVTSPDTFRQQLTYLKDHYHICDVRDFPRQPQEKDVLITFDDGYADNYTTALPILEELQIPATFFISTGHLDTDTEDWCNELAWLILEGDAYPPAFSFGNLHFKTESFQRRLSMHRSIEKALQPGPNIQRNAVMDAVRQWLRRSENETDLPPYAFGRPASGLGRQFLCQHRSPHRESSFSGWAVRRRAAL